MVLIVVQFVVVVPLCDQVVVVELQFEHHARFKDDFVTAILQDDNISALDTKPLAAWQPAMSLGLCWIR